MRNLSEIIEDCKLNKEVDYQELKYALLVYVSLMNMASTTIANIKPDDTSGFFLKMKKENIHRMYHTALNTPPKQYLGWNNDPENPEYQRFHSMANKLADKALKGELKIPKYVMLAPNKTVPGFTPNKKYLVLGCAGEYIELQDDYATKCTVLEINFVLC